ncbi:hypothetical protein [Bacteroides nordii]|uniref:immunity protein Imm33 domain-containing protein n=1 Tax=Bacteroides nordii TaxID=291645 RepID=UPI002A83B897|nr:hypothetical protein [Bacteroides nordii]
MSKKDFVNNLNTAVFTTKCILNNNSPILYVYHYEEDGAWEFLGMETDINDDDYRVLSLEEIINIDSSVLKIISIKMGYYAKRESREAEWIINKILY